MLRARSLTVPLFGAALLTSMAWAQSDAPIPGWGEPSDPSKDCTIRADGKALVIEVAASPHDLKPSGKMNAPRVLRDIEGNHAVTVKVTARLTDPSQSAGLMDFLDERNFARFSLTPTGPALEYWLDGQPQAVPAPSAALQKPVETLWLRLTRRMDKLKAEVSTDGETFQELATITIRLSSRLRLGVAATNAGKEPLSVRFEGLTVKSIPLYPTEGQ